MLINRLIYLAANLAEADDEERKIFDSPHWEEFLQVFNDQLLTACIEVMLNKPYCMEEIKKAAKKLEGK